MAIAKNNGNSQLKFRVRQARNAVIHSRNGIIATRPRSLASPVHFGRMTAFSGWAEACSGWVSRRITFDRSRLRYVRSLTGVPLTDRVASRKSLY